MDDILNHPAITVNFRTQPAAIADQYVHFVVLEWGVIEKYTGQRKYRTRVSADIERGDSWKLGMTAAHALFAKGKLKTRPLPQPEDTPFDAELAEADGVIWATGLVDDTLGVGYVSEVIRKIRQSEDLFAWCNSRAIPIKCFLPQDAGPDTEDAEAIDAAFSMVAERYPVLKWERIERASLDAEFWTNVALQSAKTSSTADDEFTSRSNTTTSNETSAYSRPGIRQSRKLGLTAIAALTLMGAAAASGLVWNGIMRSDTQKQDGESTNRPVQDTPGTAGKNGPLQNISASLISPPAPQDHLPSEPETQQWSPILVIRSSDGFCYDDPSMIDESTINLTWGETYTYRPVKSKLCSARLLPPPPQAGATVTTVLFDAAENAMGDGVFDPATSRGNGILFNASHTPASVLIVGSPITDVPTTLEHLEPLSKSQALLRFSK